MDEFAAALQFPHYFGENWAAFDECLSDMEWLLPSAGIVILVFDAADVLIDASPDELGVAVRAFENAAGTYARPIDGGHPWDRPALPFQLILQATVEEEDVVRRRWAGAGVTMAPFAGMENQ